VMQCQENVSHGLHAPLLGLRYGCATQIFQSVFIVGVGALQSDTWGSRAGDLHLRLFMVVICSQMQFGKMIVSSQPDVVKSIERQAK
jgi:hypothetical protein